MCIRDRCNGASLLRASYSSLFSAIGTAWGYADGTHFNLPDLRGRFIRGWDHGVARDPDKASRTACNANGATGDNVGSVQAEALKSHTHVLIQGEDLVYYPNGPGNSQNRYLDNGNSNVTSSTGGNETRPINANVMYCIKY